MDSIGRLVRPRDVLHYHLLGGRTATNQMAPSYSGANNLTPGLTKVPCRVINNEMIISLTGRSYTGAVIRLATGLKSNGSRMVQVESDDSWWAERLWLAERPWYGHEERKTGDQFRW